MPVFIHNGLRTPIGVVNGQYKSIRPELLGAKVLNQLFDSKKESSLDAIFCGNAVGTGGNIARLMGLYSHLPNTIPAVTVDMQCASGMMSVEMAYAHIASGMMDTVIAGGIESSSLVASVALVTDDILTAEYTVNFKKTHSQTLLPMLDEIVKMLGLDLETIDAIATAGGPGSFTGLRIGAATAKGLGLALKKPLIHVPTVDAIAYNMWGASGLICPIMDAKRCQVYTGL